MQRSPVVDAHVHFWNPALLHYPWLGSVPELQRAFLPADFAPFASGAVDAVIVIEANCDPEESTDEVAFVESLAVNEPRIAGTVVFVDLLDEDGRSAALERLRETKRVVGVRHNIQGHAEGFSLNPMFVRGVQEVGKHGLPFDLCVTSDQLREVTELVRRCPQTSFVLDHCGKPLIREDAFDRWSWDLAQLAAHDNVCCKLSGLLTEAHAHQRCEESLLLYAEHALACFGASRLLFGSDWPVVRSAGGERVWRVFTDHFTATWSADERQHFYADNAIRLYGLKLNGHS